MVERIELDVTINDFNDTTHTIYVLGQDADPYVVVLLNGEAAYSNPYVPRSPAPDSVRSTPLEGQAHAGQVQPPSTGQAPTGSSSPTM